MNKEVDKELSRERDDIQLDDDSDDEMEQSFYEAEKRRMQEILNRMKKKQQNTVLNELKKITKAQDEFMTEFEDQITDLQQITNNDQKNVIDQSILEDIKKKVFNQSMLNQISFADKQIEEKAQKEEQMKKSNPQLQKKSKEILQNKSQADLAKKLSQARTQQQLIEMGREDERSHRHQTHLLSQFFKERFIEPKFPKPPQNLTSINIQIIKPKQTFTNLTPLPNTQVNVLPKNSPQIALRKIKRSKKINLLSSSTTEVKVKFKEIKHKNQQNKKDNPQLQENPFKNNKLSQIIDEYVQIIAPKLSELKMVSNKYKPQFINEFVSHNEQTSNMDLNSQNSRSLGDALLAQQPQKIKQLKYTFQNINDTSGISRFCSLEHASLQYNIINSIKEMEKCTKLIEINLSHNKLKTIEPLKGLKWVRYLNVQHNAINLIELNGGSLEILIANNNKIEQIVSLSANKSMKKLVINNNKLHELNGLKKLHFLQEIQVKNNYIKVLEGIEDCILLRILDISNNRIQKLSDQFYFIFLNQLNLSQNMLVMLPNMFLPSLEELFLNDNKLAEENQCVVYLPNLKFLNVDNNNILGFGTIWSLLRYSQNLQVLKYDQNQCFLHIREKVRELYEYIIYRNMNKLKFLNQSPYDLGIKKYYESVYDSYLSKMSMFEKENSKLQEIQKKIMFIIGQNKLQAQLQKDKKIFREQQIFIKHKSMKRAEDLEEIVNFLSKKESNIILQGKNSLFYEHDKFQDKLRKSIHKIMSLFYKIRYYNKRKKAFYQKNKLKVNNLLQQLLKIYQKVQISKAINKFHKPLQKMNEDNAAIIIQKHWRRYITRKRFLMVLNKIRGPKDDDSLPQIDLDFLEDPEMIQPNFDIREFNFEEYIIKPQIFQAMEMKRGERDKKYQQKNRQKMVNNFVQENNSVAISQVSNRRQAAMQAKKEEDERLMKEWGFTDKSSLIALQLKKKKKEQRLRKQAQKNMTAGERYERFKKNYHK